MSLPASLPTGVQPVLNGTAVTLNSPVNIADFNTANPYGEYVNATSVLFPPGATYGDGVRIGYGLLTGGATPDFGIGCFAARCWQARQAKKSTNVGTGAMDIWRLLMEQNLNVAAVVAAAGADQ
jgi:hypothetical protein